MSARARRAVRVGCVMIALFAVTIAAQALAARQARSYLYVAVPASDSAGENPSIVVFDIANGHRFVRRIQGFSPPALVRGMAVHPATRRLYLTTTSRMLAFDLATDRVVWQKRYEDRCCNRPAVSPDGKTVYVAAFGRPHWYVIAAATGELITTIDVAGSPRQTIFSPDGKRAYLGAWDSKVITVADAQTHEVVREVGPFSDFVCPFTINRRASLAFATVDRLVGFEVGDLQTGLVLDRVIVEGSAPDQWARYECASHGIALTADERELWVADGVRNQLHVFDAETYPPAAVATVQLRSQPRWITFSRGGRYAYAATEVIDTASRTAVTALQDEHGNPVRTDVAVVLER